MNVIISYIFFTQSRVIFNAVIISTPVILDILYHTIFIFGSAFISTLKTKDVCTHARFKRDGHNLMHLTIGMIAIQFTDQLELQWIFTYFELKFLPYKMIQIS